MESCALESHVLVQNSVRAREEEEKENRRMEERERERRKEAGIRLSMIGRGDTDEQDIYRAEQWNGQASSMCVRSPIVLPFWSTLYKTWINHVADGGPSLCPSIPRSQLHACLPALPCSAHMLITILSPSYYFP